MIELRGIKKWCVCRRVRHASLVGLISFLVIGAGLDSANAGWFSLPTLNKTKDAASSKSTVGFSETIRKLLKEAKAQEEQGNLDRAMVLAQRANRIAEDSSNIVKNASDVSPAATKKYVHELLQKKVDQTASKKGLPQSNLQSRVPDRTSTKPQSTAVDEDKPKSKKFVITKIDVNDSDLQTVKKRSRELSTNASAERPKRAVVPTRATQSTLTAEEDINRPLPVKPKVTSTPTSPSEDPFEDHSQEEPVSSTRNAHPVLTAQVEERSPLLDDDLPTQVVPMPPLPSRDDALRLRTSGRSARMKLRSRYDVGDQTGLVQAAVVADSSWTADDGPEIVPMNTPPQRQEVIPPLALNSDSDTSQIQPIAAEEPGFAQVSTPMDAEPNEIDQIAEKPAESADSLSNADSEVDFRIGKVLELKRRLDSVTSLQPGEISSPDSSDLLSGPFKDVQDDFDGAELQVIRLRKQRNPFQEVPAVSPHPVITEPPRPPVIGRTSLVQWHPAKDSSDVSEFGGTRASKSAGLPNDLRQTLTATFEESMDRPQSSLPNNHSGQSENDSSHISVPSLSAHGSPVRAQLRGSLWDNAAAPSIEGYSGSVIGSAENTNSSKKSKSECADSDRAPLPPSDAAVEQTSFDTPDELFKRRRQAKSDFKTMSAAQQDESTGLPSLSASEISVDEQKSDETSEVDQRSAAGSLTDNQAESARALLLKGPVERLAFLLGISPSTASTIFGAAAMAMFFAGLCLVRALVRAEKS